MAENITFTTIQQKLGVAVGTGETNLKTTLDGLGDNPSTTDMLKMQHQIQAWSMLVQIQGTVTKELADTLKSVIQKAA